MEGSVLSFLQAEGKVSDTGSALTEPLVNKCMIFERQIKNFHFLVYIALNCML
jgi:hypothetical protein